MILAKYYYDAKKKITWEKRESLYKTTESLPTSDLIPLNFGFIAGSAELNFVVVQLQVPILGISWWRWESFWVAAKVLKIDHCKGGDLF